LKAELFDEKMQPVTAASVRLEIARLDEDGAEVPLDIVSMQREGSDDPRYKVELASLAPGSYRLTGEAELAGRVMTSQTVDISVSDVSVEFQRVAQDQLNLMRIADQSNGEYSNAGADWVERVALERRVIRSTGEMSLRTSTIVFIVVLALLAIEWVIRKRLGMV
jgi:hypothetical protein